MEDANEVQEALSRSYGTPDIDEDDLEAGQYIVTCRMLPLMVTQLAFYEILVSSLSQEGVVERS